MNTPFVTNSDRRSPGHPRSDAAGRWYRALLFLVLGCLLGQGSALQAHLHFPHTAASHLTGHEVLGAARVAGHQDARTPCPLCAEAAMSGHYLPPAPMALPVPPVLVLGVDPQSIPEFRLLRQAHGWLSRAPPR